MDEVGFLNPGSPPIWAKACQKQLGEAFPSDEGFDDWGATPRVVLQEGESVGDFYGSVPVAECIEHCNRVARCMSIAHGPHGCHLKARCVEAPEPMVPSGEQGADYRTLYRSLADARHTLSGLFK